ncbi:MAG: FtsW/RodA/SpoVE family cell cycle protein [Anaerolineales bacterium]
MTQSLDLFKPTATNRIQIRLLTLAGLFILLYAAGLTFSPIVRERSLDVDLNWGHWIGVLVWFISFSLVHLAATAWLPRRDPYLIPVAALMSGWGLLTVWRLLPPLGIRQTLWLLISAVVLIVGLWLKFDITILRRYKYIWLFFFLFLISLTLFLGTNPLGYGPPMWLGCCGFYFQPSEPLKLLLIIYLSAYLADQYPRLAALASTPLSGTFNKYKRSHLLSRILGFIKSFNFSLLAPTLVIMAIATALVIIQRDMGTALILIFIYISILYFATGQIRYFVIAIIGVVLAFIIGYFTIDIVKLRIDSWLFSWRDPSGSTYQIVQSLIAIANGGMIGRGPGLGYPNLVPISQSDFVFTAIAEESGFAGAAALLILIALLANRGLSIAIRSRDPFRGYLSAGIISLLIGQSILIISGNIRMLPLTGINLPFISYGGSSLLTTYLCLFLLLVISNSHKNELHEPVPAKPFINFGIFLFVCILLISIIMGWWSIIRSSDLIIRTDNPRRSISDLFVKRGSILDRKNNPITITSGDVGSYSRIIKYPPLSNIVGYTNPLYGQTGLEASMDNYLRGWSGNPELIVWQQQLLYGQPPPGIDIKLTLDLDLQQFVDSTLEGITGALVVLNAQSGEILAMSSKPDFNSNNLENDWDRLVIDPDSPLFNRASQGLYNAGGILGAFLMASVTPESNLPELPLKMNYHSQNVSFGCAIYPEEISWENALKNGCPAPALAIVSLIEEGSFNEFLNRIGFNLSPEINMPTAGIPVSVDEQSLETMGKVFFTKFSPLQLAVAAAAISNKGIKPASSIVSAKKMPEGDWESFDNLAEPDQIFSTEAADRVSSMLSEPGISFWEVVALSPSSDSESGNKIGTWYMAGTKPALGEVPTAVSLHIEEENPELAVRIGQAVIRRVMEISP